MTDPGSFSNRAVTRRGFVHAGLAMLALPSLARASASVPWREPRELGAFVRGEMRRANIPGLGVGFATGGVVRVARGYGLADVASGRRVTPETVFALASVTKTVTATAVMRLAEAGRLRLDEPVAPYLGFPLVSPHHPAKPITFRHLLTHTSGISDALYYKMDLRRPGRDATQPLAEMLRDYLAPGGRKHSDAACFTTAAPGAAWEYSNVGFALLGHLAGRIGGRDARQQVNAQVFVPLGIRHASWTLAGTSAAHATPYDGGDGGALVPVPPMGFADWPAGMLHASVAELTRFVAACANGGTAYGVRVLAPQSMAQMLEMRTPAGLPAWLVGQGLGWMASPLDGRPLPNHWGGDTGVFTAVYLDPAARAGVVLLSNVTATAESKAALKNIAALLLAGRATF